MNSDFFATLLIKENLGSTSIFLFLHYIYSHWSELVTRYIYREESVANDISYVPAALIGFSNQQQQFRDKRT